MTDLLEKIPDDERKKCLRKPMPDWMEPMLAKLTHDYFSDEEWIFERKLDGERVLAYIKPDGKVWLMSRNKKQLNKHYPDIENALNNYAPRGCILDGEVVAFNKQGLSDFQKLQPRIQASSPDESIKSGVIVYYYIFDCLYMEGYNMTKCSVRTRKKLLKQALVWQDPLRFTPHHNGHGLKYFKEACENGWEGIIAKHSTSSYVPGRSRKWLKFKCVMQQEFVICGFTDPQGERVGFGALLLGFYRHGNLVYAGEVGTGYDDKTLKSLRSKMNRIERKTSPYDKGNPQKKSVHFITPKLVCSVAFTEWTEDNKLRHPRFKGLREDKRPEDTHKEAESQNAEI